MSRKSKVAAPVTESFKLYFSAVGYSKDGSKTIVRRREVKWEPANGRKRRTKAG